MDISPLSQLRSNDRPPTTCKRPRSPSLYANSDQAWRSPDSLCVPLDAVTDEAILQPTKQEGVSETDVLQFLKTVPLGSKTSADNGLCQTILAPTREPRKIDFGPEMVVIAARRGSSSGVPMTIHFDIDDIQLSLISLWQGWDKTSDDVSESMCLTLACYLWADLLPEVQRTNESPSLEKLLPAARCSWPTKGGLSMVVQHGQDDWHLPLSLPFHESSENLFDVSRIVKLQKNTIRIL
ncbi:hypothetical protein PILCRDRAFT_730371 [Piloderma croceum F 1598]|uniref:Uncharacterized protein n=1 Tax=Piloderma croceum (strain F 1598) TaxID=765440 RepID=A0A0C3B7M2_PILCF|nr:hypothetical protein PILCRDRAFT_730371 [Piloderma croceum F 1598]